MIKEHVLTIPDLAHIDDGARAFLDLCKNHFFFAFYGALGSGKTTFIKSVCKALGTEDNVVSPTYSIINEYHSEKHNNSAFTIYHMDFYRLKSLEEALDIGVEDYFDRRSAYIFIEWPELVESLLPPEIVKVYITQKNNNERTLRILI